MALPGELLTVWRNGDLPQHLSATRQAPVPGWVRTKRYRLNDAPARWLEWIETQAMTPPEAGADEGQPLPNSSQLWDQAGDDGERMIFRLKRDVGDKGAVAATWLYQVHTDLPDEIADEYNQWYDNEHLPRLITVPGVLRARRYVAIRGDGPHYLTAYDLSDRDAFESPAGLVARKTPWTARMRSLFTNTRRSMCALDLPPK